MSEWRIRKDQIFWSVSTLGCRFVVRARRRCCAYTSAFGSRLSAAPGSTARAPRQTCNVRRVNVRVAWYCNSYTCSTATGGLEEERQSQQREWVGPAVVHSVFELFRLTCRSYLTLKATPNLPILVMPRQLDFKTAFRVWHWDDHVHPMHHQVKGARQFWSWPSSFSMARVGRRHLWPRHSAWAMLAALAISNYNL